MTKNNKNNRKYTIEEKEALVTRMLPPESCSTTNLSIETGISISTLSTWKSKALGSGTSKKQAKSKNKISSKEKFVIVMETYTLSEIELSKYCREHGYYVEEVKQWRASCLAANGGNKQDKTDILVELDEEKKKKKELHKELRIKDKALAETTALLVLKKKLNAIFGEQEED